MEDKLFKLTRGGEVEVGAPDGEARQTRRCHMWLYKLYTLPRWGSRYQREPSGIESGSGPDTRLERSAGSYSLPSGWGSRQANSPNSLNRGAAQS